MYKYAFNKNLLQVNFPPLKAFRKMATIVRLDNNISFIYIWASIKELAESGGNAAADHSIGLEENGEILKNLGASQT